MLCGLSAQSAISDQALHIVFDSELATMQPGIARKVRVSGRVAEGLAFLDRKLILQESLTVRFGGDEGPLFDPEIYEIMMPDSFTEEIAERVSRDSVNLDEDDVLVFVEDVLMHTLLHEIGHALVEMYQLPVLGKEEDAVDGLGTVFLIEFFDQGGDMALSAADMFALESDDRDELRESDFWDDHSLDEQRYYSVVCHVYGSDPDENADLIDEELLGEERAQTCIFEYEKLSRDWLQVLDPYLTM